MVHGLEIPFDRVTYRDGQLLTASDLGNDQTRNFRLWELHTRYLHETWGIAIGFAVSANIGDSILQVGTGYAVDQLGRPLVSSQTVAVTVPLVVGPEYEVLVIGYQSDAGYRDRIGLYTLCTGGAPDVAQEAPVFTWKAPGDVRMGTDVPLVTVQILNGAIQSTDLRARRYLQKLNRPYIAAGATDQGRTQWSIANFIPGTGSLLYQATIDTTDGIFNSTPFYFPELHMWNDTPASIYGVSNPLPKTDFVDYSGPFTFLSNPTPTSFNFNLVTTANQLDPNTAQWTVSWLGIEVAQCLPPFSFLIGILLNFRRFFPHPVAKV